MTINLLFNVIIGFVIVSQINGLPLSTNILHRKKPYENLNLFEGDIVLPPSSIQQSTGRGVLRRGTTVAWPNGIVPYQFSPGYGESQRAFIISVMQKMERQIAINNVQCVQFRPSIPTDKYHISFFNGDGCSSPVGQMTGEDIDHIVSINYPACFDEARIMHELLHTLGFVHEQSRPDRDTYIKINFDNIDPDVVYNFEKYDSTLVDTQNTPYDYASVMHYEPDAFSSNGLPTIESRQPNVTFGQRYNMSTIDIQEVRLFYNCSSTGVTFPAMPTTTTANLYVENATISSSLTETSEAFISGSYENITYYYEVFEVIAPVDGDYILTSESSFDTIGLLYTDNFYSDSPSVNLFASDDNSSESGQFQINIHLMAGRRYILVVSTAAASTTGNYTLFVYGLNTVSLTQINSSSIVSTTRATLPPLQELVLSVYSSALTTNNPTYNRSEDLGNYYYEAIMMTVNGTGRYYIESNSSIDTYGYLYLNSFNPLNTEENLITGDDNQGGDSQFLIEYEFKSGKTYILVVTTHNQSVTGPFQVLAVGPYLVTFTSLTNLATTTRPSTAPATYSFASTKFNIIMINLLIYIVSGYLLDHFN